MSAWLHDLIESGANFFGERLGGCYREGEDSAKQSEFEVVVFKKISQKKGVGANSQKRKDEKKEKEGMKRIRQSETQSVWRDSMTSRTEQTRHSQSPISKSKASV